MVLLHDRNRFANLYKEEKRRSEALASKLQEEKSTVRSLGVGLEDESKRSLALEAEMERYLVQIKTQDDELQSLKSVNADLEEAVRKARQDADSFKKQLMEAHRVAMSQASAAAVPFKEVLAAATSTPNNLVSSLVEPPPSASSITVGNVTGSLKMPSAYSSGGGTAKTSRTAGGQVRTNKF